MDLKQPKLVLITPFEHFQLTINDNTQISAPDDCDDDSGEYIMKVYASDSEQTIVNICFSFEYSFRVLYEHDFFLPFRKLKKMRFHLIILIRTNQALFWQPSACPNF